MAIALPCIMEHPEKKEWAISIPCIIEHPAKKEWAIAIPNIREHPANCGGAKEQRRMNTY